uniref:ATP phosphoribosyltransferase n=1 Tax=Trieres chinensis TaxID=1514140 RepID=A0A7S1ZI17_TRICV|eukprot:CAMPEP_0183293724 /NCGR_PEP_ID=MMETSP0160_2-20130417/2303_1 /TAXON_ID=2839 ORGANISM="Odontella Sinensis, Strain Grunow 1884" /NCGR_SAMPLE_ID=MMETSP0160_2 /ASSEMBLY_ACC=CAM_ASM_000250 /LENGTH=295 /DNA_ID=CAMNT_0025454889 /DNA_START=71 /DNA_END=958 /DNA_ORIENTATION=+
MSNANTSPPGNCKFAIPKKGRLYEKVAAMLKGSGIDYHREPRLDVALCAEFPITLVFLPAADIAKYVGEGNVDVGITGWDVVQESLVEVERILDLGFGGCKLCVQTPVANNVTDVSTLAGGRIVTSFPELTKKFFAPLDEEKGVTTKVNFVSGSVEAACGLGLADAVVDLVETGTTMRAAGLEVSAVVLKTEAILISNPNSEHKDIVNMLKRRLEGYITATKYVMISYNISNDLLAGALKMTPGKKSPNITPLECGELKAVSALVSKKEANKRMDELHDLGATDILTFQLTNTRM